MLAESNWRAGFILSAATVFFWSTLPIALELALESLDAFTLTWFRFAGAAALTAVILIPLGAVGQLRTLDSRGWWFLVFAALMLCGNYIFYLLGLDLTSPGNAQVLIQLAPILLALGAMVFFGERYRAPQWLGFFVLIAGLAMFSAEQWQGPFAGSAEYGRGIMLMVISAASWALYALCQKALLRSIRPQVILLFIYAFATLALAPTAELSALRSLNGVQWLIVGYCALNTVLAYASFAAALDFWQASRVSAVIAATPVATFGMVGLSNAIWPSVVAPEKLGVVAWTGALLVVAGTITVSLLGKPVGSRSAKPRG